MDLGVDGVRDGALDDESAKRMPEQDAVLISGAVLSSGLRDGGDRVVAIVVTGDAFRDGLAVLFIRLTRLRNTNKEAT